MSSEVMKKIIGKYGNLTGGYIGKQPWRQHNDQETCNVYHEYHPVPVATLHDYFQITFKEGVVWSYQDLQSLGMLIEEWRGCLDTGLIEPEMPT